ncbi:DUF4287 domain-containing protein [Glycomyces sp. TRM65418]|uniref:DUF4287 domain-containing protein n=1 Tax=Glycomyces sp. TRM65418 TaxID=2867006 RepID=UPI001CE6B26F|nr:DUF4287 domain-containing protein [Glycomyces sp. TRM65418]MCC3762912.1 DUF4287 domain-containing protein [Glycomyces sp. TRM65418]QZD56937.1 DUF4287 domain-containing protein [Glycomyces sp. TRM65418]
MATRPKGPTSYFPSIEKTYGRPIADWMSDLEASDATGHKALVDWLKTEHGLGHGHANALVAYHLNPGKWPEYVSGE